MSEADPNRLPGDDAKPLPADARVRWDAFKDAIGELPAAIGDPEAFGATWQAMHQIGRGLDLQQLIDALEIPEDAGEYADALRGILVRIPDGWGRWISCGRGWYPLLAELDAELARLLPRYRVYQVKEKFAGLRFYWHAGERILNPDDPSPRPSGEMRNAAEEERSLAEHEAWQRRLDTYLETPESKARDENLDRRIELAERLVERAVSRAAKTCERCGEPGECCQRATSAWYRTLCVGCADATGYVTAPDDD
jgi:hypothetical protein